MKFLVSINTANYLNNIARDVGGVLIYSTSLLSNSSISKERCRAKHEYMNIPSPPSQINVLVCPSYGPDIRHNMGWLIQNLTTIQLGSKVIQVTIVQRLRVGQRPSHIQGQCELCPGNDFTNFKRQTLLQSDTNSVLLSTRYMVF